MPELRNVNVDFVSLVDRAAVRDPSAPSEPRRFLVWKAERGADPNQPGGNMPQTEQELRDELAKAQKRIAKLEKKLTKQAETETEPSEAEQIDKSELPEPVRKALEKAEADAEETRKRAEKAEKVAKEERDRRVIGEFVAKAETMPHLQGEAAKVGALLKRAADKLEKDDYDTLESILTAANTQIETGKLYAELGSSGEVTKSDAETEVIRKAEQLIEKNSDLSMHEAMDKVLASDRQLQARYLAAVR